MPFGLRSTTEIRGLCYEGVMETPMLQRSVFRRMLYALVFVWCMYYFSDYSLLFVNPLIRYLLFRYQLILVPILGSLDSRILLSVRSRETIANQDRSSMKCYFKLPNNVTVCQSTGLSWTPVGSLKVVPVESKFILRACPSLILSNRFILKNCTWSMWDHSTCILETRDLVLVRTQGVRSQNVISLHL